MKKSIGLIILGLVVVLAMVVGVSGCSAPAPSPTPLPKTQAPPTTTAQPAPKPTSASPAAAVGGNLIDNFIFVAGKGGKGYTMAATYSELINSHSPKMKSQIQVVPTFPERVDLLVAGTAHSFMYSGTEPLYAYFGEQGLKPTKLRMLNSSGYPASSVAAISTTPATGIKSVKDLKGKRFLADYAAITWYGQFAEAVLRANGMTKDDVKWLKYAQGPEAFREIKEGRADAVCFLLGTETVDLAQTVGLYVIPLTPAEQAEVKKVLPAFSPFVIPKGAEGCPADTPGMSSDAAFWVHANLSDISAYTATKIMYENIAQYHGAYPANKGFTKETALTLWLVPYHPGAVAYYKEIGIWGAAEDTKQEGLLKKEATIFKS